MGDFFTTTHEYIVESHLSVVIRQDSHECLCAMMSTKLACDKEEVCRFVSVLESSFSSDVQQ